MPILHFLGDKVLQNWLMMWDRKALPQPHFANFRDIRISLQTLELKLSRDFPLS